MKKTMLITALGLAFVLLFAACSKTTPSEGSKNGEDTTEAPVVSTEENAGTEEDTTEEAANEKDPTKPEIIIEAGDYDGILELGSKMQSFEVSPGTVIKITGIYEKLGSTASVMEMNEAGDQKRGISLYFDYEQENLPDDTVIEVTGVAVTGDYFMEFHVSDGFLKVLD